MLIQQVWWYLVYSILFHSYPKAMHAIGWTGISPLQTCMSFGSMFCTHVYLMIMCEHVHLYQEHTYAQLHMRRCAYIYKNNWTDIWYDIVCIFGRKMVKCPNLWHLNGEGTGKWWKMMEDNGKSWFTLIHQYHPNSDWTCHVGSNDFGGSCASLNVLIGWGSQCRVGPVVHYPPK